MKYLLLATSFLISTIYSSAQIASVYQNHFQYMLDSLCRSYKLKGVSAAIYRPHEGTWVGAYGESQKGIPISTDMYFPIGSNTKTHVAAAMLKLQENGLLDINDTIGKWIQHPYINGQITIKQLLNHTSGLYEYMSDYDFLMALNSNYASIWQQDDMLQFIKAPANAPGAVWQYCNTNYLLAGIIISKVTGKRLEQALRDLVFTPAGLTETFLFPHENPAANIPHGWSAGVTTRQLADMYTGIGYVNNAYLSMAAGAGGIIATARDNVKFWDALMSGKIINATSLAIMKQLTNAPGADPYGLGMYQWPANGHTIYNHPGVCFAFMNDNLYDADNGICITIFTNQDSVSENDLFAGVVYELHRLALDMPPLMLKDASTYNTSMHIFPNPASNIMHVNTPSAIERLEIYNVNGSMVRQEQEPDILKGNTDISALPEGLYIIKALAGKEWLTGKLCIKR